MHSGLLALRDDYLQQHSKRSHCPQAWHDHDVLEFISPLRYGQQLTSRFAMLQAYTNQVIG